MHLRILDKYILKEMTATFLFSIFAFSSVFVGSGTLFRIAQYITDYGASFISLVKIFILSIPAIIMWTFPMSMLLASLLTMGRLSASSEITAMKSCGISFYRLAMPALFLGFVASFFAVWFNEYIVPWSNAAYAKVLHYEIQKQQAPKSQEHIIIKDISEGNINRIIYARRYDADKKQMEGITIQVFAGEKLTYVEHADYATFEDATWTLYQGTAYDIADGEKIHRLDFRSQALIIERTPDEIVREQKKPDQMTIRELREEIRILKAQYLNVSHLETEMYQRYTVPMASFIFTMIGTPLGIQPTRKSSSLGFVFSMIIIFLYYMLMTIFSALGSGQMSSLLAAWMPNIVGFLAGIYLLQRAAR